MLALIRVLEPKNAYSLGIRSLDGVVKFFLATELLLVSRRSVVIAKKFFWSFDVTPLCSIDCIGSLQSDKSSGIIVSSISPSYILCLLCLRWESVPNLGTFWRLLLLETFKTSEKFVFLIDSHKTQESLVWNMVEKDDWCCLGLK